MSTYRIDIGCYDDRGVEWMAEGIVVESDTVNHAFDKAFPGAHHTRRADGASLRYGPLLLASVECISEDAPSMSSNQSFGLVTCDELWEAENWYGIDPYDADGVAWIVSAISEPKRRGKRRVWERG